MPYYLHQWTYKDQQIKDMLLGDELNDRREIVKTATEAFGGTLHHFFYAFGEFDGVAIASFKDNETALACVSAIYAQGKIHRVQTTALFTSEEGVRAMQLATATLKPRAG